MSGDPQKCRMQCRGRGYNSVSYNQRDLVVLARNWEEGLLRPSLHNRLLLAKLCWSGVSRGVTPTDIAVPAEVLSFFNNTLLTQLSRLLLQVQLVVLYQYKAELCQYSSNNSRSTQSVQYTGIPILVNMALAPTQPLTVSESFSPLCTTVSPSVKWG